MISDSTYPKASICKGKKLAKTFIILFLSPKIIVMEGVAKSRVMNRSDSKKSGSGGMIQSFFKVVYSLSDDTSNKIMFAVLGTMFCTYDEIWILEKSGIPKKVSVRRSKIMK